MSDDSISQKNASFSAVEIKGRSKSLSPGACRARASSASLSASSRSGDLMETSSSASYSERELRSSTSREKYQLEASLKMLERKYAVLHKRKVECLKEGEVIVSSGVGSTEAYVSTLPPPTPPISPWCEARESECVAFAGHNPSFHLPACPRTHVYAFEHSMVDGPPDRASSRADTLACSSA